MADELTANDTPITEGTGRPPPHPPQDDAWAGTKPANPKVIVVYEDPDLPYHVVGEQHTD
jgi:hypothetical protein